MLGAGGRAALLPQKEKGAEGVNNEGLKINPTEMGQGQGTWKGFSNLSKWQTIFQFPIRQHTVGIVNLFLTVSYSWINALIGSKDKFRKNLSHCELNCCLTVPICALKYEQNVH